MEHSTRDPVSRPETSSNIPIGNLSGQTIQSISYALKPLLADVFTLFVKTKNFHWHMSGPHFRDYHNLLDEQTSELLSMMDDIAERARQIGGSSIRSIGDIVRHRCLGDNEEEMLSSRDMLAELCSDNQQITRSLRAVHEICSRHGDVATSSLIENWIHEAERRTWFLSEVQREG